MFMFQRFSKHRVSVVLSSSCLFSDTQGAARRCGFCLLSDLFFQGFCTKTLLVSLTLSRPFIWALRRHLAFLIFFPPCIKAFSMFFVKRPIVNVL